MGRVLAAADIGSNTVHLLVAETARGSIRKISDQNNWLNLGEIVAQRGEVPLGLQDQLISTLQDFKAQAKLDKAKGWYIFATEAVRVARNRDHLLKRIHGEIGVDVELVPGQREAELGLRGVMVDTGELDNLVMVEVGGGSAQIAYAIAGELQNDVSLPLGTGTLISKMSIAWPPSASQLQGLADHIRETLQQVDRPTDIEHIVGSGGVSRGIWRALHPDGEREIRLEELDYIIWATSRLTLDEIIARFSVKPRRAATLLPGAIVLRETLRYFNQECMLVSRFGVREGAILEMAEGRIKPCPL